MTGFKGIMHFHSRFSYDAMMTERQIVDFAVDQKLNFLLLTDHDRIAGSLALKKEVSNRKLEIEVPLAAEYKTEHGDVIAAFIQREISDMRFEPFVAQVRAQGGLLLLPHPFVQHTEVEKLALACDLIETFNGRASDSANGRAVELAATLGKPSYSSPDAHLLRNLGDAVVHFTQNGSLQSSLMASEITCGSPHKARQRDVIQSQYIKALKRRSPHLFYRQTRSLLRCLRRGQLGEPV